MNVIRSSIASIKDRHMARVVLFGMIVGGYGLLFYADWRVGLGMLVVNVAGDTRVS